MKNRKGSAYYFIGGSVAFLLILNMIILTAPAVFENYTGVNTTSLQDSTNVSTSVNANQTSESNVVDQAGDLVSIYTNFSSENLVLNAIGIIFTSVLIVALIDLIWLG